MKTVSLICTCGVQKCFSDLCFDFPKRIFLLCFHLRTWIGGWRILVFQVLANFMGIVMGGGKQVMFDPANVIITAGLSAAIEMLVFCLAQPGDAILIPTPYDSRQFTSPLPIKHQC